MRQFLFNIVFSVPLGAIITGLLVLRLNALKRRAEKDRDYWECQAEDQCNWPEKCRPGYCCRKTDRYELIRPRFKAQPPR